jgi:hypothetical protein
LVKLPASGWIAGAVSPNGKRLTMTKYASANGSQFWMIDLATGAIASLTAQVQRDVSASSLSANGAQLAYQVNAEGQETVHVWDIIKREAQPFLALPVGQFGAMAFHAAQPLLAITHGSARSASDGQVLNTQTGQVERWAKAADPATMDLSSSPDQSIVRRKSFGGLTISGLMSRALRSRACGRSSSRPMGAGISGHDGFPRPMELLRTQTRHRRHRNQCPRVIGQREDLSQTGQRPYS